MNRSFLKYRLFVVYMSNVCLYTNDCYGYMHMVFNATFNNIPVTSWRYTPTTMLCKPLDVSGNSYYLPGDCKTITITPIYLFVVYSTVICTYSH